jgi:hypothetical protein
MDGGSSRDCESSFIIGGTHQKSGHKWRQSIPSLRTRRGWKTFRGRGLAEVKVPSQQKPMSDSEKLRRLDPKSVRQYLNDGNYGGLYQRSDDEMMKIWRTAVEETRALLAESWDRKVQVAAPVHLAITARFATLSGS